MKASGNVASFAGELSPADLAAIASKTLSASSKFTGVMTGDNVSSEIIIINKNQLLEGS